MSEWLYMPCPLCVKENEGYRESEMWTHGTMCGGRLFIDENAIVHCALCGKTAKLVDMTITCAKGGHKMVRPKKDEIYVALAVAKIGVTENSVSWFRKLIDNL